MTSSALRRCSGALALTVLLAVGTVGVHAGPADAATAGTVAAGSSADIAARVRQLDRDVKRVGAELARGALAYERAQARLAALTSDSFGARSDAEARAAQAAASEASRGELARAAYKGGVPPLVAALLSGDPGALADLAYLRRSVDALGAQRTEQVQADRDAQVSAEEALLRTDADRRSALALRQAVDAQLAALVRRADTLTAELAVTADALARARALEASRARQAAARAEAARAEAARAEAARAQAARRAEASPSVRGSAPPVVAGPLVPAVDVPLSSPSDRAGCQPPSGLREANGFLSAAILCPLAVGGGHRLRTDAARAFDRLSAAYAASTGSALCVTDSYRSYAAQVDVFRRKPTLAATPGRSQHGWGLATDLCGGIQVFGSPAHEWMRAHAGQFGWVHPTWAQRGGSKPEAWHWEYVATAAR